VHAFSPELALFHQNHQQALLHTLSCRLFEAELQKQQEELRAKRMSQVGTGDRSEKIKTYNYKDSRCSDHRLKQNYDLNKQLDGEIEDNIQVRGQWGFVGFG
jgi:peptide chain release factor 1